MYVYEAWGICSSIPVGWQVPEGFQYEAHMHPCRELLIKGVAAVCELDVHIQLHEAAHLQFNTYHR